MPLPSPDYGIDAPRVIRNLLGGGLLLVVVGFVLRATQLRGLSPSAIWPGASMAAMGLLMLAYAFWGKFRHRDRLLRLAEVKRGQLVLDVGCGRGLLAIGAARAGAQAFGIDVFQEEDLSDNSLQRTLANVQAEGVEVDIRSEDARQLSFTDGSLDRVLSNLCLHNLYVPLEREQALAEIVRVLKPGGRAVISDFRHVDEYARYFRDKGLKVRLEGPFVFDTFPWLRVVVADKPA